MDHTTDTPNDSVNHKPAGQWEFDEDVTGCFDDMLARSIPDYDTMRKAVFELACRYVQKDTAIVDLGCSRGAAMAPLIQKFGSHNFFVGVEVSEPMYKAVCERFAGYIQCGMVEIRNSDLREQYPRVPASVTLGILTLQFIPLEYRQRVVAEVFRNTVPGGAFILVEKILGCSADLDDQFVERYYDLKHANGYSLASIAEKREALQGVLVPVTAKWNEDLLTQAGFARVDCFWRWMNFAGWIAVKK